MNPPARESEEPFKWCDYLVPDELYGGLNNNGIWTYSVPLTSSECYDNGGYNIHIHLALRAVNYL
jgi:hypothetical protein